MKLWISGEVDSDIGDAFRITMNQVENRINENIQYDKYGDALKSWDVIMVISKDGGKESFRYGKKTRDFSVRMIIPHDEFKAGSSDRKTELFVMNLIRSLEQLSSKGFDNFRVDDLKKDIFALFKS